MPSKRWDGMGGKGRGAYIVNSVLCIHLLMETFNLAHVLYMAVN